MRVAVISPFVDRGHGTERAVAELVERLAANYGDQIDLYAQQVSDVKGIKLANEAAGAAGTVRWHPITKVRGPQLAGFPRWMLSNRRARRLNAMATGLDAEVVFSPGINAWDADVILVHAVFHRLAELQSSRGNGSLRGLHRRLYYRLLCGLERRIYRDPRVALAAVSKHTARQLAQYFERRDVAVIPNGVDFEHFSPAAIAAIRDAARAQHHYSPQDIVLLLVGNDWNNKGLRTLLASLATLSELPLRLLVVGQDDQTAFRAQVAMAGLRERIQFSPPAADVRPFYAAADFLVAPSLEDSFNLPVLEAMACGLPVIVSRKAGVSEWLTHGFDSLLLKNAEDAAELAEAIRAIAGGTQLRTTLAENALATARKFSWDEHAAQLRALLANAAAKKTLKRDEVR